MTGLPKQCNGAQIAVPINGAEPTLYPHAKEWICYHTSYHVEKLAQNGL